MDTLILAVNPGSTSTKIAVYRNRKEVFREEIRHSLKQLETHSSLSSQFEMRKALISRALKKHGIAPEDLSCAVGRGGQLPPVKAGGYLVNEAMKRRLIEGPVIRHASNLGALLADAFASPCGKPAFIYDAVSSDEMRPVAKITGMPEIRRQSFCHVLNTKAMARKAAEKAGKKYEEMNYIVAHLGGGISVSAHEHGRIVDSIGDDDGPFSPERSGSVPLHAFIDLCFRDGTPDREAVLSRLHGKAGMAAYMKTSDCRKIEERIRKGDEKARQIYEAQAYQAAKAIGEMAPVIHGKIDAVILTGGLACSRKMTSMIRKRVRFLAPVIVMPGDCELEALALGADRILRKEEKVRIYKDPLYGSR